MSDSREPYDGPYSIFEGLVPPPEGGWASLAPKPYLPDYINPDWMNGPVFKDDNLADLRNSDFAKQMGFGFLADPLPKYPVDAGTASAGTPIGRAATDSGMPPDVFGRQAAPYDSPFHFDGTPASASYTGNASIAGQINSSTTGSDIMPAASEGGMLAAGPRMPFKQYANAKNPIGASPQNQRLSPEQIAKSPPFNFTDTELKQIHDEAEAQIKMRALAGEAVGVASEFLPEGDKISPAIDIYNNLSALFDPQKVDDLYNQMIFKKMNDIMAAPVRGQNISPLMKGFFP